MDRMKKQSGTQSTQARGFEHEGMYTLNPWMVFHQPFFPDEPTSHGNTITSNLRKDWLALFIWFQPKKRANHATTQR